MKKIKFLLVLLLAFMIPFAVFAEGEEAEASEEVTSAEVTDSGKSSKEVNLYFFRGEGCSHCAEAEAWFKSIEEEYGEYFKIVDYETWNDADNAELMQTVAKARGESADGVPYIIIGNQSWNGFAEDYEDEILAAIKSEFAKDPADRYDIMELIDTGKTGGKEAKSNDALALIIIILVVGGICFGIYKASQSVN